jgi:hypothetical protein
MEVCSESKDVLYSSLKAIAAPFAIQEFHEDNPTKNFNSGMSNSH